MSTGPDQMWPWQQSVMNDHACDCDQGGSNKNTK